MFSYKVCIKRSNVRIKQIKKQIINIEIDKHLNDYDYYVK